MNGSNVRIGELDLANPVLTASGCFGYGLEYDEFFDVATLGGICTKGLSLEPRLGNPPERICETPAGMLNAIGLANVGVENFCTVKLPTLRERGVTVVANIFASSVADFVKITERLEAEDGVHAIELNVSCPNVTVGGIEFGKDPKLASEVTRAVRQSTKRPVWVKMSPEAGDILAVGRACEEAGADALTAINTIRGMSIDINTRRLRLVALRIVWDLCGAVSIPVIAIGGIATWQHALEFIMAGASAVQVGTASFSDPCAAKHVMDGIAAFCSQNETTVADLIGAARSS